MTKVLFVAGDFGGAMAQVPVAQLLQEHHHEIRVLVDAGPRAKAKQAWEKRAIPTESVSHEDEATIRGHIQWADVVIAGSCDTAYQLECAVINEASVSKPSAILADVIFSHHRQYFQKLNPTWWLALDNTHKESILALRHGLTADRVIVTGQPTYDNLKHIMKNRDEIRTGHRATLNIAMDDYVVLYSSPGDKPASFETTLEMLLMGMINLKIIHGRKLVLIPRLHPKLGTAVQCDGYVEGAYARVEEFGKQNNIRIIRADQLPIDELNVTADLVVCAISTEGTKNTIMGGTTIFLLPDTVQHRLKTDFSQTPPSLPEIEKNAAIGVFEYDNIMAMFIRSQNFTVQYAMRTNAARHFALPETSATENVYNAILALASGNTQ